jgi:hypothetical protein
MATAQQIRDPITQTTSGSVRLRVSCEVRDEVCRYAARRRREGAPWAVIARETVTHYTGGVNREGIGIGRAHDSADCGATPRIPDQPSTGRLGLAARDGRDSGFSRGRVWVDDSPEGLSVELQGSPEIRFEFELREPVAVSATRSGQLEGGQGAPGPGGPQQSCIPRSQCCKVCSAGKTCGNSCISRSYNCHKRRGCACDAAEICP